MASEPAPSLYVFESRLRQPTPIHQFVARRLGGAPPSTTRAHASSATKKTTMPTNPVPTTAGISKIPKPAIVVRRRFKPAPKPLVEDAPPSPPSPTRSILRVDLESDLGLDLLEAVTTQDSAELAIATAVQQLEQLLEWRAHVDSDGALTIQVAPVDGRRLSVTGHQAQLALLALEHSVKSVLKTSRFFALEKISQVWVGSPWLRARQRNIETHAAQVLDWTSAVRVALGGYDDAPNAPTEDRASLPPPVWRALSHQPKSCVKISVHKVIAGKMILSPPKRSLAHAAYGVGTFFSQLIGHWVPFAGVEQYELMDDLSTASEMLASMHSQCVKATKEWCDASSTNVQELAVWQAAFDQAHAFAVHAVEDGLFDCSRKICDQQNCDDVDLATIGIRSPDDSFPADRFTLGYYRDIERAIAAVHVRIGQAQYKSPDAGFAAQVQEDLCSVFQEIAAWADPRFQEETSAHPCERAAYHGLINWCEQVLGEATSK